MAPFSLPTTAVGSCQSTLRDRRRSSVHLFNSLSKALSKDEPSLNDTPVINEPRTTHACDIPTDRSLLPPPSLTHMSLVHTPGHATVTTIPRYNHVLPNFTPYEPVSPLSSAPPSPTTPTTYNSRSYSPEPEDYLNPRLGLDSIKWRLASGFFACFVFGWGDGVTGTVMPHLISEFHLTTMTSSLLWAGTTCGFFAGTFIVEMVLKWLGRFGLEPPERNTVPYSLISFSKRKSAHGHSTSQARHLVLLVASMTHALYFIMMSSRSGFPLMFVAYAVAAFARALLTAPLNAYFASGPKQALGYAYGLASLGGVASPLVCQSIIATGVPWYHFYYGSLVLSGLNVMFLAVTFKPSPAEILAERQVALKEARWRLGATATSDEFKSRASSTIVNPTPSVMKSELQESHKKNTLKLALCMPYQWAFSVFLLIYCGSETTTQGFMVTYLLGAKNANPKTVGYVTSGFWGGISLGRFVWGYCTPFLSFTRRKYAIHFCMSCVNLIRLTHVLLDDLAVFGLVLQALIWIVKSHVQNSIAASFVGLFYGPIFPAALAMANDILPEEMHLVVMALINAFASLGGGKYNTTVFPFVAGTVLSLKGIPTFTLVTIPLAGALALLWALFPSRVPTKINVH